MNIEPTMSAEQEVKIGNQANSAYIGFIQPFIEQKRYVLFDAFRSIDINKTDDLKEIKRMLQTLDSLEADIQTVIETGNLAAVQIKDIH